MIEVIKTTIGHLIEFRKNVREIDLEEIEAVSGRKFDDVLLETMGQCVTLIDSSGTVLGIGGVEAERHIVWLVTTTAIETRKIEFLRFSKKYLEKLLEIHGYLRNVAYLKNKLHIDWLTWLGAKWLTQDGDFALFILKGKEW